MICPLCHTVLSIRNSGRVLPRSSLELTIRSGRCSNPTSDCSKAIPKEGNPSQSSISLRNCSSSGCRYVEFTQPGESSPTICFTRAAVKVEEAHPRSSSLASFPAASTRPPCVSTVSAAVRWSRSSSVMCAVRSTYPLGSLAPHQRSRACSRPVGPTGTGIVTGGETGKIVGFARSDATLIDRLPEYRNPF